MVVGWWVVVMIGGGGDEVRVTHVGGQPLSDSVISLRVMAMSDMWYMSSVYDGGATARQTLKRDPGLPHCSATSPASHLPEIL